MARRVHCLGARLGNSMEDKPMTSYRRHARLSIVIAFAGLVLAGGQAQAGDSPWYAAVRLGDAGVDTLLGARHPKRIDDRDTALAIDVGYTINRFLAVELGYQDLGNHGGFGSPCLQTDDACIERLAALGLCAEGTECTEVLVTLGAAVDGLSLALVPSWPISERLSLRGKAGLIAWDADVAVETGFVLAGASRTTANGELFSDRDLLAGVGLQYSFPNGLGVLIQHESFDLDAETTSLGLSWRF